MMLRDLITLSVHGITSNIARPTVEAYDFEHKLALISMYAISPIWRHPMEDPNLHLSIFLEVCDTFNLNRVRTNTIRL